MAEAREYVTKMMKLEKQNELIVKVKTKNK
jgi:hypothetical protein